MELKTNYKMLYTDRSKAQPVSAKKEVEGVKSNVVTYLVDDNNQVVDMKAAGVKFMHDNGTQLLVRKTVNGVDTDINVCLREGSTSGPVVFGDEPVIPTGRGAIINLDEKISRVFVDGSYDVQLAATILNNLAYDRNNNTKYYAYCDDELETTSIVVEKKTSNSIVYYSIMLQDALGRSPFTYFVVPTPIPDEGFDIAGWYEKRGTYTQFIENVKEVGYSGIANMSAKVINDIPVGADNQKLTFFLSYNRNFRD